MALRLPVLFATLLVGLHSLRFISDTALNLMSAIDKNQDLVVDKSEMFEYLEAHAKSSMDLLQWPEGLDNITLQELKDMLTPQKSNVTAAGANLPKLGGDLASILAGTVGSPALSQKSRRNSLDDLDHTPESVGGAVATQDSDAVHLQASALSSPVDKGMAPSHRPCAFTVALSTVMLLVMRS
uniref:EF-hand domain-containing protein n=1 Tax=Noctiluca scintillans TaxID=2966 RepID=A0A7S1F975_NOCSC